MNANTQKLALVSMTNRVDAAEQLLAYESTAAKILKISIHYFRELVDRSIIPYRLHPGRTKRLHFVDDLKNYANSLDARYGKKRRTSLEAWEKSLHGKHTDFQGSSDGCRSAATNRKEGKTWMRNGS
jgi:hypothetical protein